MKETILCDKCYKLIDVTHLIDEYYETSEEETFDIIECESCKTVNAIYWQSDVTFSGHKATDEEIKIFE